MVLWLDDLFQKKNVSFVEKDSPICPHHVLQLLALGGPLGISTTRSTVPKVLQGSFSRPE